MRTARGWAASFAPCFSGALPHRGSPPRILPASRVGGRDAPPSSFDRRQRGQRQGGTGRPLQLICAIALDGGLAGQATCPSILGRGPGRRDAAIPGSNQGVFHDILYSPSLLPNLPPTFGFRGRELSSLQLSCDILFPEHRPRHGAGDQPVQREGPRGDAPD